MRWLRTQLLWWFPTTVVAAFLATRLIVFGIGNLSLSVVHGGPQLGKVDSFLGQFMHWDSEYYVSIATSGYAYTPGRISNAAFWPLLPLGMKVLSWVGIRVEYAGFIISNVATLLAAGLLYRLVELEKGDKVASRAVWLMLAFPGSLYFSMLYTEGLFLFLSVGAFYLARRNRWLAAGALGFFVALCRANGFFILLPIGIEWLSTIHKEGWRDRATSAASLALVPLGTLSHMLYLKLRFDDPFVFQKAAIPFGRKLTWPWVPFFNLEPKYTEFYRFVFLGAPILAAICIGLAFHRKLRASYIAYASILLLFYISTNYLESIPRYLAVSFPIYFVLADTLRSREWHTAVLAIFLGFLSLYTVLWTNGYWLT